MLKTIYKVKINYKSGQSLTAWFDEISVRKINGGIAKVEWTSATKNFAILFIGVDNIESVTIISKGYRFMRWKEIVEVVKGTA